MCPQFAEVFTHASGNEARVADLGLSVAAWRALRSVRNTGRSCGPASGRGRSRTNGSPASHSRGVNVDRHQSTRSSAAPTIEKASIP